MEPDHGDNTRCSNHTKRARSDSDELGLESPQSKLVRVDSEHSDANSSGVVHNRVNSNSDVNPFDSEEKRVDLEYSSNNPSEAKRIQDDLLSILDDADEPAIHGLDSVIRSFEEEILVARPDSVPPVGEVTMETCEPWPVLGYLLGASDDELGLPPTFKYGEQEKISAVEFATESGSGALSSGEMLGLENEMLSYDSFDGFGLGSNSGSNSYKGDYDDSGDYFPFGGLFDHSDDLSGLQWQPESLSAL